MSQIARAVIARVGVDLSKRQYQVHAVDRAGRVAVAKALSPERFYTWCAGLPAGCVVAMEACSGARHVARRRRLVVIDEIGYLPIDRVGANLFFQLISCRHERGPMILTSNRSFGAWDEVFGDCVIATA